MKWKKAVGLQKFYRQETDENHSAASTCYLSWKKVAYTGEHCVRKISHERLVHDLKPNGVCLAGF
jgi:hypothetical protein